MDDNERLGPADVAPAVGGAAIRPGPFTVWTEEGCIHFGPGWPENPFDWRYGHTFAPVDADE